MWKFSWVLKIINGTKQTEDIVAIFSCGKAVCNGLWSGASLVASSLSSVVAKVGSATCGVFRACCGGSTSGDYHRLPEGDDSQAKAKGRTITPFKVLGGAALVFVAGFAIYKTLGQTSSPAVALPRPPAPSPTAPPVMPGPGSTGGVVEPTTPVVPYKPPAVIKWMDSSLSYDFIVLDGAKVIKFAENEGTDLIGFSKNGQLLDKSQVSAKQSKAFLRQGVQGPSPEDERVALVCHNPKALPSPVVRFRFSMNEDTIDCFCVRYCESTNSKSKPARSSEYKAMAFSSSHDSGYLGPNDTGVGQLDRDRPVALNHLRAHVDMTGADGFCNFHEFFRDRNRMGRFIRGEEPMRLNQAIWIWAV